MPDRPGRLVVAKLGGSLLDWEGLPGALLKFVDDHDGDRLVIVVGGGAIVDVLRGLDRTHGLGEERSHALALRAMDLTAVVVAAIVPGLVVVETTEGLGPVWERRATPVFAPRRLLDAEDRTAPDALPHHWDVTSDSIAARIAVRLGAEELVLLKSTAAPEGLDRPGAAAVGLVDPRFPTVSEPIPRVLLLDFRTRGAEVTDLR